jgi:hypothetical protein
MGLLANLLLTSMFTMTKQRLCFYKIYILSYTSHVCGGTHLHFPFTICATNGTAGSLPGPALIGHEFGGQGSSLQSRVGPQHKRPQPLKLSTVEPQPPALKWREKRRNEKEKTLLLWLFVYLVLNGWFLSSNHIPMKLKTYPVAYLTAVGVSPLRGERSIVI